MREENLVRQFQNNPDYLKIKKIIDEQVRATLYDRRKILEFASLSVLEAIRDDREKYSSFIRYNASSTSTIDFTFPDFPFFLYGQRRQQPQQRIQSKLYFIEDYVAMLSDKLAKEVVDEVINEYVVGEPPQPSLPQIR